MESYEELMKEKEYWRNEAIKMAAQLGNRKIVEEMEAVLSGNGKDQTVFETGAVRDSKEGKGRCDLMPLHILSELGEGDLILKDIAKFGDNGDTDHLYNAVDSFIECAYDDNFAIAFLELAKHFEEGAKKYGENNWQKGIPERSYIDSGVRHYLQWLAGDKTEHHDRAFIWNMVCLIWDVEHKCEKENEG